MLIATYNMDKSIVTYRKQQKFLYDWKEKYSKLIELDKTKRSAGRIVNFVRKYVLFPPCNLSESMINEIPGIYRFRCYVYDIQTEMDLLNDIYNSQAELINLESDINVRHSLIMTLKNEINNQKKYLINLKCSARYGILIDLRNYLYILFDVTSDIYVSFNDKNFILDDATAKRLIQQCEKINPNSIRSENFMQMINHSKALSQTYNLDKIK